MQKFSTFKVYYIRFYFVNKLQSICILLFLYCLIWLIFLDNPQRSLYTDNMLKPNLAAFR